MNYHWNLSDNPKLEKLYSDAPKLKNAIEEYIAHHISEILHKSIGEAMKNIKISI